MTQRLEYTVLDIVESAVRNSRVTPLNLGGVAGVGGGVGGPPGGFIGWLPQTRVAYDYSEIASSGIPASGMSILDNLNHIRYRLNIIESGSATFTVIDDNTPTTISDVDTIHFSGAGVSVTNLGSGDIRVSITSSGGGTFTVIDDNTQSTITNVDTIHFSGVGISVTDLGGGDVKVVGATNLHIYNEDLTAQVPAVVFSTQYIYASGTLQVYFNGIRQRNNVHYLENNLNATFSLFFPTSSGDFMIVDYEY